LWFLAFASLAVGIFAAYKTIFTSDWDFLFAGWIPWICLMLAGVFCGSAIKIEDIIDARFRLILTTACIDGNISEEEVAVLKMVAKKFGISDKRVKKDLENLANGTLKIAVPEDDEEKRVLLQSMISMMKVDNKIDEKEMAYVLEIGKKLGFSESYIKSNL
jgi:uncharacterized tellurite resistance protein B-like protein